MTRFFSCFFCLFFLIFSSYSQTGIDLRIDGEIFLTDKNGVINPQAVISAAAGKLVRIYMVDGTCHKGIITESRIEKNLVKIFGRVVGNDQITFGFGASRDGDFGGALLDKTTKKLYTLEYNSEIGGFIFIFSKRNDQESNLI